MMGSDFWIVVKWWGTLFLVGAVAFPLTKRLFSSGSDLKNHQGLTLSWYDRGYLFAKAVGMAMVTYLAYLAGILHVLPFTTLSIWIAMGVVFLLGLLMHVGKGDRGNTGDRGNMGNKRDWGVIVLEEAFFFLALLFWSWVKGHEPSIHGLEKFMDFGFTQSILNSQYFPAPDMWYSGLSINYYYFGHTVLAVLTKLSGMNLAYTFNLMLATIFAFTLTMSFSIGVQLIRGIRGIRRIGVIAGGALTAFLVTLAGNMQTIYAFTRGYTGENVKPFWELAWKIGEVGQVGEKLLEGMERYWYANATRFIPFTIHEFPSYSFVVSDVHGHVLSIPFVLLAIALLIKIWGDRGDKVDRGDWGRMIFYGFLCGVLLMTNALDGPIYLGLLIVLFILRAMSLRRVEKLPMGVLDFARTIAPLGIVIGSAALMSIPFLMHFKSFVSGIAINCPPSFLANTKIGPFLFEGVEKCQHSPFWMLWLLWGFFWYCGIGLIIVRSAEYGVRSLRKMEIKFTQTELLLVVFFVFSILLTIFPEFFYFKDIYPAHFRSNTMFKLGYQAFIMFSIVSGYTIVQFLFHLRLRFGRMLFFLLLAPQLFLVSIYPLFSVRSYFNSLREYKGLYGLTWMKEQYPDDWEGIEWMNQNAKYESAVLVEADGDSYTDHARYSAFTGLPAVIGWPVHEWLWRGGYDVVAPRREIVRKIYESEDLEETRQLIKEYHVSYIVISSLERVKYPKIAEWKFEYLADVVFKKGSTTIYKIQ